MTFTTKNNQSVTITGVESDTIINESLFTDWINQIDPTWTVHSIEIQSIDRIPNGRILFVKVKADIEHADGRMPGMIVVIRDYAVAALTILNCEGEQYALLVDQPRVPVGAVISESVAGLIDDGDNPRSVILRELEEEAHMVTRLGITADDVVALSDKPFFLSPGVINEAIYPFLVEKDIDHNLLNEYHGIKRGLAEENETITVKIVPLSEITNHCNCATTLAMLHLYDRYRTARN